MNRRDAVAAMLVLGIVPHAWAQRVFRIGVLIDAPEGTQRAR
jgi:hypothetical protein